MTKDEMIEIASWWGSLDSSKLSRIEKMYVDEPSLWFTAYVSDNDFYEAWFRYDSYECEEVPEYSHCGKEVSEYDVPDDLDWKVCRKYVDESIKRETKRIECLHAILDEFIAKAGNLDSKEYCE